MHQLFSPKIRSAIVGLSTVGLLIYCLSNYVWDLPHADFRPFKVGTDVAAVKTAEEDAAANVKVLSYKMTNKGSGAVKELPYADFMKQYKDYPKEEWEYEQIKSEPTMEASKISDFAAEDADGNNIVEELLSDPSYHFVIVSYKLKYDAQTDKRMVIDTTYSVDTMIVNKDSFNLVRKIASIDNKELKTKKYFWDKDFQSKYKEKVNPLAAAAEKDGYKVSALVGGAGTDVIDEFRHATQTPYPFYMADDILLKTIVRSNPGVVLFKNGKIVNKWHINKLPDYAALKAANIK